MALLESILEGLTNPTSGALRDLSAKAATEFLTWSAKHIAVGKSVGQANNFNASSLLRRLFDRVVHLQIYQRYYEPLPLPYTHANWRT